MQVNLNDHSVIHKSNTHNHEPFYYLYKPNDLHIQPNQYHQNDIFLLRIFLLQELLCILYTFLLFYGMNYKNKYLLHRFL
nr:MAG TPA: hypothetical protein [Caudoviricetes sp.]